MFVKKNMVVMVSQREAELEFCWWSDWSNGRFGCRVTEQRVERWSLQKKSGMQNFSYSASLKFHISIPPFSIAGLDMSRKPLDFYSTVLFPLSSTWNLAVFLPPDLPVTTG